MSDPAVSRPSNSSNNDATTADYILIGVISVSTVIKLMIVILFAKELLTLHRDPDTRSSYNGSRCAKLKSFCIDYKMRILSMIAIICTLISSPITLTFHIERIRSQESPLLLAIFQYTHPILNVICLSCWMIVNLWRLKTSFENSVYSITKRCSILSYIVVFVSSLMILVAIMILRLVTDNDTNSNSSNNNNNNSNMTNSNNPPDNGNYNISLNYTLNLTSNFTDCNYKNHSWAFDCFNTLQSTFDLNYSYNYYNCNCNYSNPESTNTTDRTDTRRLQGPPGGGGGGGGGGGPGGGSSSSSDSGDSTNNNDTRNSSYDGGGPGGGRSSSNSSDTYKILRLSFESGGYLIMAIYIFAVGYEFNRKLFLLTLSQRQRTMFNFNAPFRNGNDNKKQHSHSHAYVSNNKNTRHNNGKITIPPSRYRKSFSSNSTNGNRNGNGNSNENDTTGNITPRAGSTNESTSTGINSSPNINREEKDKRKNTIENNNKPRHFFSNTKSGTITNCGTYLGDIDERIGIVHIQNNNNNNNSNNNNNNGIKRDKLFLTALASNSTTSMTSSNRRSLFKHGQQVQSQTQEQLQQDGIQTSINLVTSPSVSYQQINKGNSLVSLNGINHHSNNNNHNNNYNTYNSQGQLRFQSLQSQSHTRSMTVNITSTKAISMLANRFQSIKENVNSVKNKENKNSGNDNGDNGNSDTGDVMENTRNLNTIRGHNATQSTELVIGGEAEASPPVESPEDSVADNDDNDGDDDDDDDGVPIREPIDTLIQSPTITPNRTIDLARSISPLSPRTPVGDETEEKITNDDRVNDNKNNLSSMGINGNNNKVIENFTDAGNNKIEHKDNKFEFENIQLTNLTKKTNPLSMENVVSVDTDFDTPVPNSNYNINGDFDEKVLTNAANTETATATSSANVVNSNINSNENQNKGRSKSEMQLTTPRVASLSNNKAGAGMSVIEEDEVNSTVPVGIDVDIDMRMIDSQHATMISASGLSGVSSDDMDGTVILTDGDTSRETTPGAPAFPTPMGPVALGIGATHRAADSGLHSQTTTPQMSPIGASPLTDIQTFDIITNNEMTENGNENENETVNNIEKNNQHCDQKYKEKDRDRERDRNNVNKTKQAKGRERVRTSTAESMMSYRKNTLGAEDAMNFRVQSHQSSRSTSMHNLNHNHGAYGGHVHGHTYTNLSLGRGNSNSRPDSHSYNSRFSSSPKASRLTFHGYNNHSATLSNNMIQQQRQMRRDQNSATNSKPPKLNLFNNSSTYTGSYGYNSNSNDNGKAKVRSISTSKSFGSSLSVLKNAKNIIDSPRLSKRQHTIMNIVTKQSLLACVNVLITISVSIFLSVVNFETIFDVGNSDSIFSSEAFQPLLHVFFLIISICLWLSFAFAEKQYYCVCKYCDTACQLCCKHLAITKIKQHDQKSVEMHIQEEIDKQAKELEIQKQEKEKEKTHQMLMQKHEDNVANFGGESNSNLHEPRNSGTDITKIYDINTDINSNGYTNAMSTNQSTNASFSPQSSKNSINYNLNLSFNHIANNSSLEADDVIKFNLQNETNGQDTNKLGLPQLALEIQTHSG